MCFASPKAQVSPVRKPNYTVEDSYGQVTSSQISPDGKVTGGGTIRDTVIKMGKNSKTPKVVSTPDPDSPHTKSPTRADYMSSGASIRM